MTTYPFWGGPWDGDVMEYADHETPDDYLGPEEAPIIHGKVEGLYVLNDAETGYAWAHGPWTVAPDENESRGGI